MSKLLLAFICISYTFLLCCSPYGDVLRMVERGDYSMAYAGKYPQKSSMLYSPSDYDQQIVAQRKRIEKNLQVMNELHVRLYHEEKSKASLVNFEYRGSSVNEESDELILWYMGPMKRPRINAGYRAQWVYNLKKGYLRKVHLSIVPLE